jgi:hypothetical protein
MHSLKTENDILNLPVYLTPKDFAGIVEAGSLNT